MNRHLRHYLSQALLVLLIFTLLSACKTGSDGSLEPDPFLPTPNIFGLHPKNWGNPGETIQIEGRNFGTLQANGMVRLGSMQFQVVSWSDTLIEVMIVAGMQSGIVTVTQNNRTSVSGPEAQLHIGQVPTSGPVVQLVTPAFGRIGQDEVSIIGSGFGSLSESAGVFFTAAASHSQQFVKGTVVDNPVTGQGQWTSTNIKVRIPADAAIGAHELYVQTTDGVSNSVSFEVLPPLGQLGDPLIHSVSPLSGPIGQEITVVGNNFDAAQGASTLVLVPPDETASKQLLILSWGNNQISARIPEGARTGKLRLIVGGQTIEFPTDFVVANTPVISGLSPSDLRIGQSVTIFGQFFGPEPGKVQIGGTTFTPSEWSNSKLVISSLTSVVATDVDNVPVTVTNEAGLVSLPFLGRLRSDLIGGLSVSPRIGVANLTEFTFGFTASGGSGNYTYTLIPNMASPGQTVAVSGNQHKYKYTSPGTFTPGAQIRDNSNGDILVVSGPQVTVRAEDEVVILGFETLDFGRLDLSENDRSRHYQAGDIVYGQFAFPPPLASDPYFSAGGTDVTDAGGAPLTSFTRNQGEFVSGGLIPRPYGYRQNGPAAGRVRIKGINFGTTKGEVWLRSNGPGLGHELNFALIESWSATEIDIMLPPLADEHLGGLVTVVNVSDTEPRHGVSTDPLIVSPFITSVAPADPQPTGSLFINGRDLSGPPMGIDGIAGTQTYLFFVGQASYTDPFSGTPTNGEVLFMKPYPVTVNNGESITFPLDTIMQAGQVKVLAANAAGTQFAEAMGTPQNGSWQFFLWSAALKDDGGQSKAAVANSGVFSGMQSFNIGGGGGGNQPPTVSLAANPVTGSPPMIVNFTATANDPDGAITLYEWDFEGTGTFVPGTASESYTYTMNGIYDAVVRVTDDGVPPLTATDTIQIRVTGGPPGP